MKKNCQLYHARDLWDEIFNYEKTAPAEVMFNKLGDLIWRFHGQTYTHTMLASECGYSINMPLYEVVMVDEDGDDVYGLLFFEEN